MEIESVIVKYGIADNMQSFVGNSTENIRKAYWLVWDIDKQVKALKAPKATNNGNAIAKPVHAFDKKAEKDDKAKATADKLIDAFLKGAQMAMDKNGNVAFHLAKADKDIQRFFTNEVDYLRYESDKNSAVSAADKVVSDNAKLTEFQSDRAILVEFLRSLTLVGLLNLESLPDGLKKVKASKGDKEVLDLPSLRGPKGNSETPAGKFAKLSYYEYTIDGNTFPLKTDVRFIIRSIWDGIDRVGKRIGDLDLLINTVNGGKAPKTGESVSFTVGKHELVVRVGTKEELAAVGGIDEEDMEDDESEDNESE